MIIAKIKTVRFHTVPRILTVIVETDGGIVGIGETYDKVGAVESAIHESLSPLFLGADPRMRQRLWSFSLSNLRFHGIGGAEMRALSAIEIALWDIHGKILNAPLVELLGGAARPVVPVYNTCIGHATVDDFARWKTDPADLARELIGRGYRGMKIWPFDALSAEDHGNTLSSDQIARGVSTVASVRKAAGSGFDIFVEMHGLFTGETARRICDALEPHGVAFVEDPMPVTNRGELARLAGRSPVPIAGGEALFTRWAVKDWLSDGCSHILVTDVAWNGGIAETLRIAAMAEAFGVPVALHNAGGPISHRVNEHLGLHLPNLYRMEVVRAFAETYFQELSSLRVTVSDGYIQPDATAPGIGIALTDVERRPDATSRVSEFTGSAPAVWTMGDSWDKTNLRL